MLVKTLFAILICTITLWWVMGFWFMLTIHTITLPVYLLWQGVLVHTSSVTPLSYIELMLIIVLGIGMSHLITYIEAMMYEE